MSLAIAAIPYYSKYTCSESATSIEIIIPGSSSMKEMAVRYSGGKKVFVNIQNDLKILDLSGVQTPTQIYGKCDEIFHSSNNLISLNTSSIGTDEDSLEKSDISQNNCIVSVHPKKTAFAHFVHDDRITVAVLEPVEHVTLSYRGQKKIFLYLKGGSKNVNLTSCFPNKMTVYGKCPFIKQSSDGYCSLDIINL